MVSVENLLDRIPLGLFLVGVILVELFLVWRARVWSSQPWILKVIRLIFLPLAGVGLWLGSDLLMIIGLVGYVVGAIIDGLWRAKYEPR